MSAVDAPRRDASFDRMGSIRHICRLSGEVYWIADAAGRLTDISGHYMVECP